MESQSVEVGTPDGRMPAHLALPETPGRHPAGIVRAEERASYQAEAATDAWQRLRAFFARTLH